MQPAISIVMTTYNREDYLEEAIASVLQQTRGDFEFVIWDDGSTDRSLTIARRHAERDARVRVVAASHQGRGRALHQATQTLEGQYVGWVDSDDRLRPTALEETARVLEQHDRVGMAYTNYTVVDERGAVLGEGQRCQIPYSKERLLVDFMTFHFRLIRRSAFDRAGGIDPEFACAQDYDLCLRLSEITSVAHLKKSLYEYRVHDKAISRERQMEQIEFSRRAIANALARRGLSDSYEVEVQMQPRYILRPRKYPS